MGHIIETNIEGLGIEERRESYYIYELNSKKEHIFQFKKNGIVEISKEFLNKILKFFNKKEFEKFIDVKKPEILTADWLSNHRQELGSVDIDLIKELIKVVEKHERWALSEEIKEKLEEIKK